LKEGKGGLYPFYLIYWESSLHPESVQDNSRELKGSRRALCFVGCNGIAQIPNGQEHAIQAGIADLEEGRMRLVRWSRNHRGYDKQTKQGNE